MQSFASVECGEIFPDFTNVQFLTLTLGQELTPGICRSFRRLPYYDEYESHLESFL